MRKGRRNGSDLLPCRVGKCWPADVCNCHDHSASWPFVDQHALYLRECAFCQQRGGGQPLTFPAATRNPTVLTAWHLLWFSCCSFTTASRTACVARCPYRTGENIRDYPSRDTRRDRPAILVHQ